MKKIITIVIAIALVACTACCFVGCNKNETIVIGYDNGFPPMGFVDENGNDVGFDLDLAKATFEEIGVDIEFKVINWSLKETLLNSCEIDVIWNGYTITDARRKLVSFSVPYLKNSQCIVVRKNSPLTSIAEIASNNAQIVVQSGSSAVEAMYENALLSSRITKTGDLFTTDDLISETDNNVQALQALESQAADAFATDYVLANYLINTEANQGKYIILTGEENELWAEEYGIGVRKEDTKLLSDINEALNTLKENGKLAEIAGNWGLADALLI